MISSPEWSTPLRIFANKNRGCEEFRSMKKARLPHVMCGLKFKTLQGLTWALKKWSVILLPRTRQRMHELREEVGDEH